MIFLADVERRTWETWINVSAALAGYMFRERSHELRASIVSVQLWRGIRKLDLGSSKEGFKITIEGQAVPH